jgi:hypothetical protein
MNASVCFVLHHVCKIFAYEKLLQTIFIKYEKTGVTGRRKGGCTRSGEGA